MGWLTRKQAVTPPPRKWWRNSYGAVTDGSFELYHEPLEHLRDVGLPPWKPWCLYDVRSGTAVLVSGHETLERGKAAALLTMPVHQPKPEKG